MLKRNKEKNNTKTDYITLKNADIDFASEQLYQYMIGLKVQRRVALQNRLMLEEIMYKYRDAFGTDIPVELAREKRAGGRTMVLKIKCDSMDPFSENSESELLNVYLSNLGLTPVWKYKNGYNCIVFSTRVKKKVSDLVQILIGVVLGFILGFAAELLPADFIATASADYLTPIQNTVMAILGAVATMLIFLSVAGGVCNMGDMSTFNKIGKKMLGKFMLWMIIFLLVGLLVLIPFFKLDTAGSANLEVASLLQMVLNIVPRSLVEPFVTGNTLQVIFIAVCVGIILLMLNVRASNTISIVNECTELIQIMLDGVLKFLPLVVFISIFNLVSSGQLSTIASVYKYPLLIIGADFACLLINTLRVCITKHVKPGVLIKKAMPAYSIGLATASSPAAYSTNVASCINSLGISKQLVDVGIPLGQVIYMPASILEICCVAMCMGEMYDTPITLSWIVTLSIIAFIMGIATPPLPGATISCHMLVMAQLGIPAEAIAVVIALDALVSRISTSTNIYLLQTELVLVGGNLNLLDRETLAK